MIKELKRIENMSIEEIMYVVASEYIDEICTQAVKDATVIMSNPILRSMICQAAETKLAYEEQRKNIIIGRQDHDCFYDFNRDDLKAYKTVLYNNIFYKYGANSANV